MATLSTRSFRFAARKLAPEIRGGRLRNFNAPAPLIRAANTLVQQEEGTRSGPLSSNLLRGKSSYRDVQVSRRAFSSSDISDKVTSIIDSNKVVVFSKSYCPYCTRTKQMFGKMGIDAEVIELDERSDGDAMQAALMKLSGQRTVPNVFISGKHLGGSDDTLAARRSGRLEEMLN